MSTGMGDPSTFGRVDDDGTVFVRTSDGERAVGSWHAGDAAAGLAHFARRYEDLWTEVALLDARLSSGAGTPGKTRESAQRIRDSLSTASVVGDLDALAAKIDAVLEKARQKSAEAKLARAAEASAITDRRRALVEEAERLAESTEWKATGERFKVLVEEWKAIRGGERAAEQELWHRLSVARRSFTHRRDAHFAELDRERDRVRERKEELVRAAESLRESDEWGDTAKRYKQLMADWKVAGRAQKSVDDELWSRFRAAQDAFFTRRAEHFARKDAESAARAGVYEALLAEAEQLDPSRDLPGSQNRLRDIQEKWEKAGPLPRDIASRLEDRLRAVETKIRDISDDRRRSERPAPENPMVATLRAAVAALEAKAAKGDARAAAELDTKREWLRMAEQSAPR